MSLPTRYFSTFWDELRAVLVIARTKMDKRVCGRFLGLHEA